MSNEPVIVVQNGRHGDKPAAPPLPAEQQPLAVLGTNLVSILIPCCGQLEYTNLCLPALLRHTRAPFELLFLDVGSLDGTADYLAGFAAALPSVRVEVLHAATDLAVPAVCTEALTAARGEALVLL